MVVVAERHNRFLLGWALRTRQGKARHGMAGQDMVDKKEKGRTMMRYGMDWHGG